MLTRTGHARTTKDKDQAYKDQDKDKDLTHKDQDKDKYLNLVLVLKDSLRSPKGQGQGLHLQLLTASCS